MPHWLIRRRVSTPNRLALKAGSVEWTFAELAEAADRAAYRLAAEGVRPGDRVAVLMRNGAPFAVLVKAVSRLGAVLVPLNVRLSPAELAWQLRDVSPSLLVYDETDASLAFEVLNKISKLSALTAEEAMAGAEPNVDLVDRIDLSQVHCIIYTSGTTGRPKGAMLTYGNHWWSAVGSVLNLGLTPDDRWLACLPLFHIGGLAILMRSLIYGIPAFIHPRFDPEAVNRAIDEDRITIVSVVANMLQRMLESRGEKPYPDSLRCILLGGGPAPRSLLDECARRHLPVVQTYGLTEAASQVTTLAPEDALRKLGSAGKPLFPTEVRIERDGRPAGPGEVGEILLSGPTISPGYFNAQGKPLPTTTGGWLHTGDLGYMDEEGYLYVVDRRDDLIISGGENVYPAEVEAVLLSHPAVTDAGVVGIPDPRWGQVPAAAVVLHAGRTATAEELTAFCRLRLAAYKVPKRLAVVESLPRTASGKLSRRRLREWFRKGEGELH